MERYLGDYFSVLTYGLFGIVLTLFVLMIASLIVGLLLWGFIKGGKVIYVHIREAIREPAQDIIRKWRKMGKKATNEQKREAA
jgi:lipopolysaccharide/colanic/teichoic acid biosynthesis glycosyltransferase